ncbi:DMT family transporter [Bacillaceae bacterium Marseille-Q3522]|nr:DMT family transporter [Bacillaceae bacterium Marseille-Q3522]
MIVLFLIGGMLVGMSVPVQTSINAKLARNVGSPFIASLISMFVGLLALVILSLAIDHRITFNANLFLTNPWWIWVGGGVLGAIFLMSNILLLPRLGAALTVVITLCGQMIMAICIDEFGWFGVPVHELNVPRIIGVICMLVGVILMRKF